MSLLSKFGTLLPISKTRKIHASTFFYFYWWKQNLWRIERRSSSSSLEVCTITNCYNFVVNKVYQLPITAFYDYWKQLVLGSLLQNACVYCKGSELLPTLQMIFYKLCFHQKFVSDIFFVIFLLFSFCCVYPFKFFFIFA